MEAIFGESSYIDSWMQLVRKVSWNFPGLETEDGLEEHKQTVLKFMNKLQAVCVKDSENDEKGIAPRALYKKFGFQRKRICR